jgi:hypothetical protein
VLLLNFDLPNASRQAHLRHPDGSIMEPEIPSFTEGTRSLFGFMMEVVKTITAPVAPGAEAIIQTVVVDTVGELYRRLLEEFSNRSVRPSLPTYGEVSVQVERFCRALCMAPNVNTILVCHDLLVQNGEETVSVPFTGTKAGSVDMGAKLASMVDIVAYTAIIEQEGGEKQAVAQLIPLKGRNGGDRFDCLGDWRPLDISEWIATIAAHERGEKVVRFDHAATANVGTKTPAPPLEDLGRQEGEPAPTEAKPATRGRRKAAA